MARSEKKPIGKWPDRVYMYILLKKNQNYWLNRDTAQSESDPIEPLTKYIYIYLLIILLKLKRNQST